MADWSSEQYLKFEAQRTQPSIDLVKRINVKNPSRIIDIGCGPGNSTAVVKKRFQGADILGVDYSEDMLKKAREKYPNMRFERCDANNDLDKLDERYDVVFSNACLQWLDNHETLIPKMSALLNKGGEIAVQIPMNEKETIFLIMREQAKKWGIDEEKVARTNMLSPSEYYDILSGCCSRFEVWETVYYHSMPDCRAIVEWVKGTALRPYLAQLTEKDGAEFCEELILNAQKEYKPQKNGDIIFRFRRFFFIGEAL